MSKQSRAREIHGDARGIAAHLAELERVNMGLPERQVADLLPVARKLLDLQIAS